MTQLNSLFVPYDIALMAEEKKFNEECFGIFVKQTWGNKEVRVLLKDEIMDDYEETLFPAPLYQQLVDWFRKEHGIIIWIETAPYAYTFNFRFYIETSNNKQEGNKSKDYYKVYNEALTEAFKLIK